MVFVDDCRVAEGPEIYSLIVNADDLGLSLSVNAGIATAHEHGIVTSASLMVRQGGAAQAAAYAIQHPALAIGLHLDLSGWHYERGERRAPEAGGMPDAATVEAECRAQLRVFRRLLGRDPTHVDSHHHVHGSEPVSAVATRFADELGVPLRGARIPYEGRFYGRTAAGEPLLAAITVEALSALIASLPAGWTEIGCHPGLQMKGESSYDRERELEVATLCDPRVREAIEREAIELRSFACLE